MQNNLVGKNNTQHTFPHFTLLQVEFQFAPPFQADSQASSIQTGGIRAQRHVLDVIKNSKIIADEIDHRQMMYLGNIYISYSLSIHGFCALATNVGLFCGI